MNFLCGAVDRKDTLLGSSDFIRGHILLGELPVNSSLVKDKRFVLRAYGQDAQWNGFIYSPDITGVKDYDSIAPLLGRIGIDPSPGTIFELFEGDPLKGKYEGLDLSLNVQKDTRMSLGYSIVLSTGALIPASLYIAFLAFFAYPDTIPDHPGVCLGTAASTGALIGAAAPILFRSMTGHDACLFEGKRLMMRYRRAYEAYSLARTEDGVSPDAAHCHANARETMEETFGKLEKLFACKNKNPSPGLYIGFKGESLDEIVSVAKGLLSA